MLVYMLILLSLFKIHLFLSTIFKIKLDSYDKNLKKKNKC